MVRYLDRKEVAQVKERRERENRYKDVTIKNGGLISRFIFPLILFTSKYKIIIECNMENCQHYDVIKDLEETLSGNAKLYCSAFLVYKRAELPIKLSDKRDLATVKLKYPEHFEWISESSF